MSRIHNYVVPASLSLLLACSTLNPDLSENGKIFTQGPLIRTESFTDLAIEGDGFFQITLPGGEIAYTRNGHFLLDSNGILETERNNPLFPEIKMPMGTSDLVMSIDGKFIVVLHDSGAPQEIGNITLALFDDPSGLHRIINGVYRATTGSGPARLCLPGYNGAGVLEQGYLEGDFY